MDNIEVTAEEVNNVLVTDLANENLRLRQENARLLIMLGRANAAASETPETETPSGE